MDRATLLQITNIETINRQYVKVLGDRIHTDGTHTLYTKGVIDGMEILLLSLEASMTNQKKITDQTSAHDK
jgi:hypothetical protein